MKKTIAGLCLSIMMPIQLALGVEQSLSLRIDSPTREFNDPDQFVLSIEIQNMSGETCVVFPAYLRRNFLPIEGQGAQFVAYPGPVINPWPTALLLNAGERKTVTLSGVEKQGEGVWKLERGSYNLSVSLHVAPTSTFGVENPGEEFRNKPVWRGSVESNSITIRYLDQK